MLEAYLREFATDNHKALLQLMTEDIVFSDPLAVEVKSKAALTKHLAPAKGVLADVTQAVKEVLIDGSKVFLIWEHVGTNTKSGKRYGFKGSTFLRFNSDGLVEEHRDYFDPRILIKQFKPATKSKL